MNIIIFGASGMVGHGVLLECLDDPSVTSVKTVGRSAVPVEHAKLTQISHSDFLDFSAIADQLGDLDACFWCLGVASSGMTEEAYTRITHDFTVAAAKVLLDKNPGLKMCFISGQGTDPDSKTMWARVKGKAENALLEMPFAQATMFRPGFIRPLRGVKSKTKLYRFMYIVIWPFTPLIMLLGGKSVTDTVSIGQAMLNAVKNGTPKAILDNKDINNLAEG